jgi:CheY-like chemotaxis protein
MPYAALTFVEVDQVFFKSKVGFDLSNIHRNDWFDAFAILPDSSEVFVVSDCFQDKRFQDKKFVRFSPHIRFYAGAAIILDDVRLGVLSVMDTQPHPSFTLEDKENLLDLGAAVAQLAGEKLQTALNLSAERANIVVSMMHHLRTPMTSLNFATSLLCNDVQQMSSSNTQSRNTKIGATTEPASEEKKDNNNNAMHSLQSFEASFNEIHASLNQLNVLVDSSLSLGQAIIKCSNSELLKTSLTSSIDQRSSKFSECNIIDYLTDIFNNSLPAHKHSLEVEWTIDSTHLVRGSHVSFPDAIMLVVISTFSHMSTESDSLAYYFSFEQTDEDNLEYPELVHKMLEGSLSIKVFSKDNRANDGLASNSADAENEVAEMPSKQNFLSIDKIIRAINGSARELVEDISSYCTGLNSTNSTSTNTSSTMRNVQEFFIPCKILLSSSAVQKSPNQERKKLRLYRPPTGSTSSSGNNAAGSVQVVEEVQAEEEAMLSVTEGAARSLQATTGEVKANRVNRSAVNEKDKEGEVLVAEQTKTAPTSTSVAANTTVTTSTTIHTAAAPSSAVSTASSAMKQALRVLIIEDTIPVQKLLARWLHNHGCQVSCANNGKIGLDQLQANVFDIVFVDFLMVCIHDCTLFPTSYALIFYYLYSL